jgi:hypothetical protein
MVEVGVTRPSNGEVLVSSGQWASAYLIYAKLADMIRLPECASPSVSKAVKNSDAPSYSKWSARPPERTIIGWSPQTSKKR